MNSTSDAESNSGFLEEIASVVTVIRDGDDRVLFASSSNDRPWSCLGGAVRSGESLEDAARRYPQEDCGVTVELRGVVANLTGERYRILYECGQDTTWKATVFNASLVGTQATKTAPTIVRWFTPSETQARRVRGVSAILGDFATVALHDLGIL